VTADLAGRAAIVTGGGRGLGSEITAALARAGARVLITGRDREALAGAADRLTAEGFDVLFEVGDVSNLPDAERAVARALEEFGELQILVNNAGIYGPTGPSEEVEWSDWVRAVEINLFGSVLMTRLVVPHFRAAGYGKIVQLSGGGATAPLPNFSAYAASKAAVVRFAETLAQELEGTGIDVNSIAPGALNTGLLDEVLAAGPEKVGAGFYERALRQQEDGGAPLERGASLTAYLCSAESDGITGRLISAIWDPWESLAAKKNELLGSDVFTLRRIVPADRGIEWPS
jgi:NAD(P)-dependent dehydrogenase (short-subunit alcohol dehydrogenase family)